MSKVKVIARIRPFLENEDNNDKCVYVDKTDRSKIILEDLRSDEDTLQYMYVAIYK